MPQTPRIISDSGYMHVINRGNARQIIFEERADYILFLNLIKRYGMETNVKICAYCLMENHTHLLIHDPDHNMPVFMLKLNMSYASYFNRKYHRSGHVFQGRYTSVPIDSESRLLTVFRYILQNPQAAGICPYPDYEWSSYKKYGLEGSFVDTNVFQELIGNKDEYDAFLEEKYEELPEMKIPLHDDNRAKEVIRKILNVESGTILQSYSWEQRNEALVLLKENGLSIRQIERLTGINRNAIQRAKRKK